MNIYRCWYHGISGFAGKLDCRNWLFVPDLGQVDTRIHRKLRLSELVFRNRFEYDYEQDLLSENRFSLRALLRPFLLSSTRAGTTAGMLLLPENK